MPYNQFLAIGEETSWGSAATRTKFAKVLTGSGLHHRAERQRSAKLSANVGADPESSFDKSQSGEGKLLIPMSYDDGVFLKVLKHTLGAVAAPSGGGPYTHIFTRAVGPPFAAGAVPTATSLSTELNYELPDTGPLEARLLTGARVASANFSWNAGEEFVMDCDLLGKEVTQVQKTGSPTFPTYETYEMKFAQAALSINGTGGYGAICSGIDFTINNGYEKRIRLGSVTTQAPLRRGVAQLSGNIRLDWEATPSSKTLWDLFKANTSCAVILTLTGGSYSMTVKLAKVFFNESNLTPEEGQLQSVEFPFEAYHDATDTACKITVVSPNATV